MKGFEKFRKRAADEKLPSSTRLGRAKDGFTSLYSSSHAPLNQAQVDDIYKNGFTSVLGQPKYVNYNDIRRFQWKWKNFEDVHRKAGNVIGHSVSADPIYHAALYSKTWMERKDSYYHLDGSGETNSLFYRQHEEFESGHLHLWAHWLENGVGSHYELCYHAESAKYAYRWFSELVMADAFRPKFLPEGWTVQKPTNFRSILPAKIKIWVAGDTTKGGLKDSDFAVGLHKMQWRQAKLDKDGTYMVSRAQSCASSCMTAFFGIVDAFTLERSDLFGWVAVPKDPKVAEMQEHLCLIAVL